MDVELVRKAIAVTMQVKGLIEVDQNERIYILHSFVWGTFGEKIDVPDFSCADFKIENKTLTILATGNRKPICDGSSLAPNKVFDFDTITSSIGHDLLYAYQEEIAEAWGWDVEDVRKLADDAFGCDLLARAKAQDTLVGRIIGKATAHVYHWFVRKFGGIYHNVKKFFLLAFIFCCLIALSGCTIPEEVFIPTLNRAEYVTSNNTTSVDIPIPSNMKYHFPSQSISPTKSSHYTTQGRKYGVLSCLLAEYTEK